MELGKALPPGPGADMATSGRSRGPPTSGWGATSGPGLAGFWAWEQGEVNVILKSEVIHLK